MYVYVLLNCISNTVEDDTTLHMNKSMSSPMGVHVYSNPNMIDEAINDTSNLYTISLQYPGIFKSILKNI